MLEYESDTQALASTCMSVCKVCHSGHHLVLLLHKLRAFAAVQCLAAVGFMKPIIGTKHLESCFKLTMWRVTVLPNNGWQYMLMFSAKPQNLSFSSYLCACTPAFILICSFMAVAELIQLISPVLSMSLWDHCFVLAQSKTRKDKIFPSTDP